MVIPWICFAKRSINWRRNLNNAGSCWTLSGMRTASTLYASWWRSCIGDCRADASSGLPFLDMKKITRESLKKAEKGSGVYTMGSVYKLPDTWTSTFDLSNHEKVSARNDYAEKPLKKVVEEIVERKNGDRMQRNMPYFVRFVVDYFYDRMRKTKNLQYGDRTQNHGQYKTPYTKIWTNQVRTVLFWCLLQLVQDRIPEKCWEEGLQNPEWSWYVQFQRAA